MDWIDFILTSFNSELVGSAYGFLGFGREMVEWRHMCTLYSPSGAKSKRLQHVGQTVDWKEIGRIDPLSASLDTHHITVECNEWFGAVIEK